MAEIWYRYDGYATETGSPYLGKYPVVKTTAKGVWIDVWGKHRFVLLDARKRWAYPTKELALNSFLIRRTKQVQLARHLEAKAQDTVYAIGEFTKTGKWPGPFSDFEF